MGFNQVKGLVLLLKGSVLHTIKNGCGRPWSNWNSQTLVLKVLNGTMLGKT